MPITERRAPLTPSERALLRRRALVAVPVGLLIGAAVVWMLGSAMAGFALAIRVIFGLLFGGILAFILGVYVRSAFEREKLVRTGVVTGKRVGIIGPSVSSQTRASPRYHVSLDGEEFQVEQWVYQRVRVGQTVDLVYTAKLRNLFAVTVVADPTSEIGSAPASRPFEPSEMAHEEAVTEADRGVLRALVAQALVRRVAGGLLLGGVAGSAVVVAWVMVRATQTGGDADQAVIRLLTPGAALCAFSVLNRRTYLLVRDLVGGSRHVQTEHMKDLVRSNTPLLSPTTVVTGTGLAGDYAWAQTEERWVPLDASLIDGLSAGAPLQIATGPRSGAVLAVGGFPAAKARFGVIDLVVGALAIGGTGCLYSVLSGAGGAAK